MIDFQIQGSVFELQTDQNLRGDLQQHHNQNVIVLVHQNILQYFMLAVYDDIDERVHEHDHVEHPHGDEDEEPVPVDASLQSHTEEHKEYQQEEPCEESPVHHHLECSHCMVLLLKNIFHLILRLTDNQQTAVNVKVILNCFLSHLTVHYI